MIDVPHGAYISSHNKKKYQTFRIHFNFTSNHKKSQNLKHAEVFKHVKQAEIFYHSRVKSVHGHGNYDIKLIISIKNLSQLRRWEF